MTAILVSLAFGLGLFLGATKGIVVGEERGRKQERLQVIAFLVSRLNDQKVYGPERLAKAIDDGEHLRWNLK